MEVLKKIRSQRGISQRRLALRAGTSYKTLQLLERGAQDCRLSTLENLAAGLGYPKGFARHRIAGLWELPVDSIAVASYAMSQDPAGWRVPFFNFVDAFRKTEDKVPLLTEPPLSTTPQAFKALLASTAEALSAEARIAAPEWCQGVPALEQPWFVSGIENLKASALVESPAHFRRRNIFVLENFLARA